jgi:hypothetical protein
LITICRVSNIYVCRIEGTGEGKRVSIKLGGGKELMDFVGVDMKWSWYTKILKTRNTAYYNIYRLLEIGESCGIR